MSEDAIWLAPLLGFTEYHFRNVYTRHFKGLDAAVLPFVTLVEGRNIKAGHIKDVWPEHNDCNLTLVPQVLGNSGEMFITMNRRLMEMGYKEVNWNLGCPAPRVAAHKRGSGLLPYPTLIRQVLETVFKNPYLEISVKLRLGYKSADDIQALIPILNDFPLKSVCIHPRIGIQMYDGYADRDAFGQILPELWHPVIYNGDIFTAGDFHQLKQRFPQVEQWMVGRGIFLDPFLPEKIKGLYKETPDTAKQRFEAFNEALFEAVIARSFMEQNALNKMKEYWKYFSGMYETGEEVFDKIKYCNSKEELQDAFRFVYQDKPFKEPSGYPTS